MSERWQDRPNDGYRAAPGTLEATIRTHPNGNHVVAVWNDCGQSYKYSGKNDSRRRRKAERYAERILREAQDSLGPRREVVASIVVNMDKYERHTIDAPATTVDTGV